MIRTKQVYDSEMVAHLWANASQTSARNSQGNFRFDGATLWSYATPIAYRVERKGSVAYLISSHTYSVTTSKQQTYARRAASGRYVFSVPSYGNDVDHAANVEYLRKQIAELQLRTIRARSNAEFLQSQTLQSFEQAIRYVEFFGLRYKIDAPTFDAEAIREPQRKADERNARRLAQAQREQEAREQARREQEAKNVEGWIKGEYNGYVAPTLLRLKTPDIVETSKGAEFPLSHAIRLLPLIRSGVPYQRNGHSEHIGHFVVDAIDAEGNVTAGCHVVLRSEIERFAASIGL